MLGVPESLATLVFESVSGVVELHPSTAPEVIAAQQRREVAEFFAAHPEATVEEASAELILPVVSVHRCMTALAGVPIVYREPGPPTNTGVIPAWPRNPKRRRKVTA